MSIPTIILSVILFLACLFLIAVVLLQSGKSSGVAGALSGNSDTFLSKNKSNSWDGRLARITKWVAFVFMILVLVLTLIQ